VKIVFGGNVLTLDGYGENQQIRRHSSVARNRTESCCELNVWNKSWLLFFARCRY